jgi:hypothetical protein
MGLRFTIEECGFQTRFKEMFLRNFIIKDQTYFEDVINDFQYIHSIHFRISRVEFVGRQTNKVARALKNVGLP